MSKTRLQLLKAKAEGTDQEQLILDQVDQDKLQLQADRLETRKALGKAKRKLAELESAEVLSPSEILTVEEEIIGYEKGLEALDALEARLFPSE